MKAKQLKKIGSYQYKKHMKKKFGAKSKKKANYRAEKLEMKQIKKKMDKEDEKNKKRGKKSGKKQQEDAPELSGKKLKNYKTSLRKKAKKEKNKEKSIEKRENAILNAKDHVKFGEVVHGPPELTSRPRGMTAPENDKRNGLLLLEKLQTSMDKAPSTSREISKVFGKRQKLSKDRLQELEDERNRVISTYRSMKSKRKVGASIATEGSSSRHCNFLTVDDV